MGVINPMAADAGGGMRLGMSPIGMADTAAGMGGIGGGVTGMGDAAAAGAGAAGMGMGGMGGMGMGMRRWQNVSGMMVGGGGVERGRPRACAQHESRTGWVPPILVFILAGLLHCCAFLFIHLSTTSTTTLLSASSLFFWLESRNGWHFILQ